MRNNQKAKTKIGLSLLAGIAAMLLILLVAQNSLSQQERELENLKIDLQDCQASNELLIQEIKQAELEAVQVDPIETKPLSVEELIEKYATEYGVDVGLAKRIAYAESKYNPSAQNKSSTASGVYQFLNSSWKSYSAQAGLAGADVFDPEANVHVAIWTIANYGTSPWNASKHAWN